MADELHHCCGGGGGGGGGAGAGGGGGKVSGVTDNMMFDCGKKVDEKTYVEVTACEFEKISVSEAPEQKTGLLQKLHRSSSSSSSSSEEDVIDEDGKGRRKKKGLKAKMEDWMAGNNKETAEKKENAEKVSSVPIEVVDVPIEVIEEPHSETKGFLDKIKDKLPGAHKKTDDEQSVPEPAHEEEKEKKSFLEKIKEKLPGHRGNRDEKVTSVE